MSVRGLLLTGGIAALVAFWMLRGPAVEVEHVPVGTTSPPALPVPPPTPPVVVPPGQVPSPAPALEPPDAAPVTDDGPAVTELTELTDQALLDTMAELRDAAETCPFEQFATYVDLSQIDPALPIRAMLDSDLHPSDADYVRRAMEDAADTLRELLEHEGCWPTR